MRAIRYIPCTIERGGFSSERTFSIPLDKGEEVIVGCADTHHVRDSAWNRIPDKPVNESPVNGYVKCQVLRKEKGCVLVEVPSRHIFTVDESLLVDDPNGGDE